MADSQSGDASLLDPKLLRLLDLLDRRWFATMTQTYTIVRMAVVSTLSTTEIDQLPLPPIDAFKLPDGSWPSE